jgi:hypothetical protein
VSPDAQAIGYGALETGDIVPAEVDLYTFTGAVGDFITVTLARTAGFTTVGQEPRVSLISPSNEIVEFVDAHGQKNVTLDEAGTWVLRVNANNFVASGSYALGLESIKPVSPDAQAIGYGALETGDIVPAEVDLYTFTGAVGDFITVTLARTAGFTTVGQEPRVSLISPSNEIVVFFDANGQIERTLDEAGTWVLRVNANNFVASGSYSLGLTGG